MKACARAGISTVALIATLALAGCGGGATTPKTGRTDAAGAATTTATTTTSSTPTAPTTASQPAPVKPIEGSLCRLSPSTVQDVMGEPMRPGRSFAGAAAGVRGCTYASVAIHVSSDVQHAPNVLVVAVDRTGPVSCQRTENVESRVLTVRGGCILVPLSGPRSIYRAHVNLVIGSSRLSLTAGFLGKPPSHIQGRLVTAARRLAAALGS